MQVAKYWRNKKLRYRLIRDMRTRKQAPEPTNTTRVNGTSPKARVELEIARPAK